MWIARFTKTINKAHETPRFAQDINYQQEMNLHSRRKLLTWLQNKGNKLNRKRSQWTCKMLEDIFCMGTKIVTLIIYTFQINVYRLGIRWSHLVFLLYWKSNFMLRLSPCGIFRIFLWSNFYFSFYCLERTNKHQKAPNFYFILNLNFLKLKLISLTARISWCGAKLKIRQTRTARISRRWLRLMVTGKKVVLLLSLTSGQQKSYYLLSYLVVLPSYSPIIQ